MKIKQALFLLVVGITLNAQISDVLDHKHNLKGLEGITKAERLNTICNYYLERNWDSVYTYAKKLENFSKNHGYPTYNIVAKNYLGKVAEIKTNYKEAHQYYQRALSNLNQNDTLKIAIYEGIGNMYLFTDQLDSANIYFDKAIDLARDTSLEKKVKNLKLYKGLIANEKTLYKEAIEILLFDYEYFKKCNDNVALFNIYNNVGNAYFQLYDLGNAKKYYSKALGIAKQEGKLSQIGRSYGNLGNTYGNWQKFDSCALYFQKSYSYFQKSGETRRANLTKLNLLNLFALTGENEKLIALADSLKSENLSPEHRIILLHSKSRAHFNLGDKEKADQVLQDAFAIAKRLDSKQSLYKLYQSSIDHYLRENNLKIRHYFQQYDSILNHRFDRDNKEIISKLSTKVEIQERESLLTKAKLKAQKQETYMYGALSGVLFLLMLLGGIVIYNRHQRKSKESAREKERIELQRNMAQLTLSNLNNQIDSHDFKNTITSLLNEVQEKAPDSYNRILGLLKTTETALYNDSFTDTLGNQLDQAKGCVSIAEFQLFEPLELKINNQLRLDLELPKLLVKNLVENSIKHGIKGTKERGNIIINGYKEDENYILEVIDDGRGLNGNVNEGKGISVYMDLLKFFNQINSIPASLNIINTSKGVKVKLTLPSGYKFN